MADQLDELTERQHYWLEHIRACEAAGQSTLQYAQAHGFESRAMYKARQQTDDVCAYHSLRLHEST